MRKPVRHAAPHLGETVRWNGLRIGLLGGSFNPPHAGHVHASLVALKYLQLDAVWWLVSPGNPFKSGIAQPSLADRAAACEAMVDHPDIVITAIENELGTVRTFSTVRALQERFPQTDFIWLSGTDLAYEFHRWHRWRELTRMLPFAFIGRPTRFGLVRNNVFRRLRPLRHHTLSYGSRPALAAGHIYWIFTEPLNPLSSTMLRSGGTDLQGTR